MAKQIIQRLIDDFDGGDADETVKFALDGVQYEIDLSKKNATKLRNAIAPYLAAGSKVGRGGVVVGGRAARGAGARDRSGPEQGHPRVGEEGRQGHRRPGPDPAGDRRRVPREGRPVTGRFTRRRANVAWHTPAGQRLVRQPGPDHLNRP